MPQRFETFLKGVSASRAAAKATSDNWLVLVSARTSGFTLSYLKVPIYALGTGIVIEGEAGATALIKDAGDIAPLVARLQIAATPLPAGEVSGGHVVTGKLVLKAHDVFASRGYVLSSDATTKLLDHLLQVADFLKNAAPGPVDLQPWAGKAGKQRPTLIDILQNMDGGVYPQLPKLPAWANNPVLSRSELQDAQVFVEAYMNAAVNLVEKLKHLAEKKADAGCGLFYVREEFLGFGDR